MSLSTYRKKRDFKKTSEPAGGGGLKKTKKMIFVVQEHHASRLHYDFRLEAGGVLLSWAVPKGPSMNPKDRRLAVQVEDHPLDYATFHGVIPKGEYGAGHVEIWDHGHWDPPANLKAALKKGHLEFELHGEKLTGRWNLVRLDKSTNDSQPNWLLMKKKDDLPTEKKVLKPTGRAPASSKKKSPLSSKPPEFVDVQLAQLVAEPPTGPEWTHEIKYDGYRTLCRIEGGEKDKKQITFLTRSGLDWTKRYGEELRRSAEALPVQSAIIDGEIVVLDKDGHTNFQALQIALKAGKPEKLVFYAFDLLFLNGEDIRSAPLRERKKTLAAILKMKKRGFIYSEDFNQSGEELFKKACAQGLEGIVSKDGDAEYVSGRTPGWQKTKCSLRQEFVIGGFTAGPHGDHPLGAILIGYYDEQKKLRYAGRIGTGFTVKLALDLLAQFKKLKAKMSSFTDDTKVPGAQWIKPTLVAEVEFRSWENESLVRQGSFKGLRLDKDAGSIVRDTPTQHRGKPKIQKKTPGEVIISHPDRIIFPEGKIQKHELITFAYDVSDLMLPYVADRPLSLLRCPGNIKSCFFQKHIEAGLYDAVHVEEVTTKGRSENVMWVNNARGIIQLYQWGAVELHGWQMKGKQIAFADQIIFDLDPDEAVPWSRVRDAALNLRELLLGLNLTSFVKVTGGKGLHIHVPLEPRYGYEDAKSFSKSVAELLAEQNPGNFVTVMTKSKRKGKIFLDYLRNGWGSTAILPYAVRARENAPVALPIAWEDLKKPIDPGGFLLREAQVWLKNHRRKNPWKNFWKSAQRIQALEKKNLL